MSTTMLGFLFGAVAGFVAGVSAGYLSGRSVVDNSGMDTYPTATGGGPYLVYDNLNDSWAGTGYLPDEEKEVHPCGSADNDRDVDNGRVDEIPNDSTQAPA
jgi:hypothetical protein